MILSDFSGCCPHLRMWQWQWPQCQAICWVWSSKRLSRNGKLKWIYAFSCLWQVCLWQRHTCYRYAYGIPIAMVCQLACHRHTYAYRHRFSNGNGFRLKTLRFNTWSFVVSLPRHSCSPVLLFDAEVEKICPDNMVQIKVRLELRGKTKH